MEEDLTRKFDSRYAYTYIHTYIHTYIQQKCKFFSYNKKYKLGEFVL